MNKQNKKILLIIPAYNEELNINKTIDNINNYNKKKTTKIDYIVINDGSKDKTLDVLKNNNINHIDLIHNLGIGGAVQTGYKYALKNNYDIAIQFDGDGQHDINYVSDLINEIDKGYNLVIGSRFIAEKSKFKSTFTRRIGINVLSKTIKMVTGAKIYDTTSGFRACDKSLIEKFSKDYPTEYPEPISNVEIIKRGYSLSEIPVEMNERENGESSIKAWKAAYYMINVVLSIIITACRRGRK